MEEPEIPISEFGVAKAAIWLRESNGKFSSEINECILRFGYTVIHMDEGAAILLKQSGSKTVPAEPIISIPAAFIFFFVYTATAFYGLFKP
jgi:hypothetical protein